MKREKMWRWKGENHNELMHCSRDCIDLFFNRIHSIETWSFSAFIRMNQNPCAFASPQHRIPPLLLRWDQRPAGMQPLPPSQPLSCPHNVPKPALHQACSPYRCSRLVRRLPQITCPVWQAGRTHGSHTATLETLLCSHLAHCLPCPQFTRPSSPGRAVPRA